MAMIINFDIEAAHETFLNLARLVDRRNGESTFQWEMTPEIGSDPKNGPDPTCWVSFQPTQGVRVMFDVLSGIGSSLAALRSPCEQNFRLRKLLF